MAIRHVSLVVVTRVRATLEIVSAVAGLVLLVV